MKTIAWAVGGVALGIVYVLLVGILGIQIIGARAGAVFDLNNELVAVTSPSVPVLQMIASALLSGLVFYVVTIGLQKRTARIRVSTVAGFVVAVTSLVIWSFVIAPDAVPLGGASTEGIAIGWEGWIQEGGVNPAVHVLIVLVLGAHWPFWSTPSTKTHLARTESVSKGNGSEPKQS
ncbi:hypothetical protein ACN28C_26425 [Plantactinospora sp. WMMC1484]|uniref:hypothetical protein n=1 Tax=Plantactinospora sp. WMMC1484 TaxID=3404122 RepID=UPI003BF5A169